MSWEIRVYLPLRLCLGCEQAVETGIFCHSQAGRDRYKKPNKSCLGCWRFGMDKEEVDFNSSLAQKPWKRAETGTRLESLQPAFCRQRERKNKAAADWDSWVKKLQGKNSSRLSNNLPVLGMSEKTASGCGESQACYVGKGRQLPKSHPDASHASHKREASLGLIFYTWLQFCRDSFKSHFITASNWVSLWWRLFYHWDIHNYFTHFIKRDTCRSFWSALWITSYLPWGAGMSPVTSLLW